MKTSFSNLRCFWSKRGRKAFTLTELLVVIAVISILAGILIPTMSRVRRSANVTRSLSNLKGIGQAVLLYTSDKKGKFPPLGQGNGFNSPLWTGTGAGYPDWSKGLNPYLPSSGAFIAFNGSSYTINAVHVDPLLADDRHHPSGDYGANREVFKSDGAELMMSQIVSPGRTVLVATAETTTQVPPVGSWFVEAWNWANGIAVSNPPSDRGTGRVPVVFIDGHVEQLEKAKLDTDQTYRRSLFLINP